MIAIRACTTRKTPAQLQAAKTKAAATGHQEQDKHQGTGINGGQNLVLARMVEIYATNTVPRRDELKLKQNQKCNDHNHGWPAPL